MGHVRAGSLFWGWGGTPRVSKTSHAKSILIALPCQKRWGKRCDVRICWSAWEKRGIAPAPHSSRFPFFARNGMVPRTVRVLVLLGNSVEHTKHRKKKSIFLDFPNEKDAHFPSTKYTHHSGIIPEIQRPTMIQDQ